MKLFAGLLVLVAGPALLTNCTLGRGSPEPRGPEQGRQADETRMTIWDGVYTTEQAARGERTAWATCFSCHSAHEWGNPTFMRSSSTWRLGDLFNTIRQSMPYDTPGALSADAYADIVAYMLKLQKTPAGEIELPSVLDELDRIMVTPNDGS